MELVRNNAASNSLAANTKAFLIPDQLELFMHISIECLKLYHQFYRHTIFECLNWQHQSFRHISFNAFIRIASSIGVNFVNDLIGIINYLGMFLSVNFFLNFSIGIISSLGVHFSKVFVQWLNWYHHLFRLFFNVSIGIISDLGI
jgi:hypothetical protein